IITYGCQQNVSDSERIRGILDDIGFEFTDDKAIADFIIFNTCAVREHAEDRVFGNVGALKNLKRKNPKLIIALCGCMAQQSKVKERIKNSFSFVDLLFGTFALYRLPQNLYKLLNDGHRVFDIDDKITEIPEGVPVKRDGTFKGWLPIMYGCNNFCTYCIVPYVRGRERSRSVERIVEDAKMLIADGCKDITLLGQNVNSYNYNGTDFPDLLKIINDLDGDFVLRFMTSHPKDCSEKLIYTIRDCEKVARHLHLPFQSGSTRILTAMNRRYTKEKYLALIQKAYDTIPDLTVTSDIIVGFPGETYEDFLETLDVVKKVKFLSLFTFIFSPRNGTPAAKMEDPIDKETKGRWFSQLLETQSEITKDFNKTLIGKTFKVLCDEAGRKEGYMAGHTSSNICLEFKGDITLLGQFLNVKVVETDNEISAIILEE
ncbi:MAG: tRNA (N6-isopentenyl adenosine(37)-C2)-methylthiotransferase MiaB, partial [Oscillospiraceae bacterium]|nr:tRNA (N6-isopentenyl adenosine(37)-C2)-methylthiotransferase MiaB [Candidatus Equicaccousia limihippi]